MTRFLDPWTPYLYGYLYGYLTVGLVVLALALILNHSANVFEARDQRKVLDVLNPRRRTWYGRLVVYLVAPLLTGIFLVLIWPITLFNLGREFWATRSEDAYQRDDVFAVRPEDLRQAVTLEAVEAAEHVEDPLGAVPNVPFGHLHHAWRRFINGLDVDDELWRFAAVRHPYPDWTVTSEGYALVSHGRVREHWVASIDSREKTSS